MSLMNGSELQTDASRTHGNNSVKESSVTGPQHDATSEKRATHRRTARHSATQQVKGSCQQRACSRTLAVSVPSILFSTMDAARPRVLHRDVTLRVGSSTLRVVAVSITRLRQFSARLTLPPVASAALALVLVVLPPRPLLLLGPLLALLAVGSKTSVSHPCAAVSTTSCLSHAHSLCVRVSVYVCMCARVSVCVCVCVCVCSQA